MKNLKPYKRVCLLALFFFLNVFASKADVKIATFKIYPENLAPGGGLNVPDKNASTPFKFYVSLSRFLGTAGTGQYESGNCRFVLVYKDNYGTTIDLASKDVTDVDFNDKYTGTPGAVTTLPMEAVLPQGKLNGTLYLRFTYHNSAQNKELTEDRTNERIQVVYVEKTIPKAPVYMVAGTNNGEYYLSLNDAMSTPAGWSNRGIYYYGYKTEAPGTIPVYEFKGKSYDRDGEPGLPANLTYYSTSNQKPTETLTGSGSYWEGAPSKVAFYAYSTQVPGTIPVYCYSHERINLFLFIATGEVSDLLVKKHIAFYAFPAQ